MRLTKHDRLQDGASLLEAVRENEHELPGVAPYLAALEKAHAEAVSSYHRRDALLAANQEATRQLNDDLADVQDTSIALRFFIKSVLGFYDPKLGNYGIRPRKRRRPRRVHLAGPGLPI